MIEKRELTNEEAQINKTFVSEMKKSILKTYKKYNLDSTLVNDKQIRVFIYRLQKIVFE